MQLFALKHQVYCVSDSQAAFFTIKDDGWQGQYTSLKILMLSMHIFTGRRG